MHFLKVCHANDKIVTWFSLEAKWLVKKGNSKVFSTLYAHTEAITGATNIVGENVCDISKHSLIRFDYVTKCWLLVSWLPRLTCHHRCSPCFAHALCDSVVYFFTKILELKRCICPKRLGWLVCIVMLHDSNFNITVFVMISIFTRTKSCS